MSKKISRREFIKLTSLGAAASAVLVGRGQAPPFAAQLPVFEKLDAAPGDEGARSTTTCGGCPAGCGLIVTSMAGRVTAIDGNPTHPLNQGAVCAGSMAGFQSMYAPDRLQGPQKVAHKDAGLVPIEWDQAVEVVARTFTRFRASEIAFLVGAYPDHLNDLLRILAQSLGEAHVLRYDAGGMFEGRVTLMDAALKCFGTPKIPTFDLQVAEVAFAFGADFSETWLSPTVKTHAGGAKPGYLVQFASRLSQGNVEVDEWVPIRPGSEAVLASALTRLAAELARFPLPTGYEDVDFELAAEATGVPRRELERLARRFAAAESKVAIPGRAALGGVHGLAAAEAILALNVLVDNLGREGGVFLTPDLPVHPGLTQRSNTMAEMAALVERMQRGEIKALFLHGVNPLADLPGVYGFAHALENVELVISFASRLNETAARAHYILPDHSALESWGYQKVSAGADRPAISALQPAVAPSYNTRATADVLLAAVRKVGGDLAENLDYHDEMDFLQKSVVSLMNQGGIYEAHDLIAFWQGWVQHGGWWTAQPVMMPPVPTGPIKISLETLSAGYPLALGEHELHLLPYVDQELDNGGGDQPARTLEDPEAGAAPRAEIHPQTASRLGVKAGDLVKVASSAGIMEAVVHECATIQPDAVAIPIRRGRAAKRSPSSAPGVSSLDLLGKAYNDSGDQAYMAERVKVSLA